MRIYYAGTRKESAVGKALTGRYALAAFDQARSVACITAGWNCKGWLLDSGAFAAWSQGKAINLGDYCDTIKELAPLLDGYFALDVIGGTAEQNLGNLDTMEDHGLRPIPVFHEGDDWELIREYIRRGYEYIGIAGVKSRGEPELCGWILDVLCKFPPSDKLRFHGLAMTQERIINNFSDGLFSVDSATWINPSRYGIKGSKNMFEGRSRAFMLSLGVQLLADMNNEEPLCLPSQNNSRSLQVINSTDCLTDILADDFTDITMSLR